MTGIRILAFHDVSSAPLVRMLSVGWANLDAHAWDNTGSMSRFWTIYRNSATGTTLWTRDGEVAMEAGTAYLIPQNTWFARRNRQSTSHLFAYFDLIGFDSTATPAVIRVAGSSHERWLAALARSPRKPTPSDAVRLSTLVLRSVTGYADTASCGPDADRSLIAPALAAMQADPARSWSLAELAARCGCISDTFGRRFRATLGCTPVQWLRTHRARLAAHRLVTTGESLAGIARSVGFGSRPYLSRVFRVVFGAGPAEYRQARRRSGQPLG